MYLAILNMVREALHMNGLYSAEVNKVITSLDNSEQQRIESEIAKQILEGEQLDELMEGVTILKEV